MLGKLRESVEVDSTRGSARRRVGAEPRGQCQLGAASQRWQQHLACRHPHHHISSHLDIMNGRGSGGNDHLPSVGQQESLYRSAQMSLVQIYMPTESAHAAVTELAQLGNVMFKDVSASDEGTTTIANSI